MFQFDNIGRVVQLVPSLLTLSARAARMAGCDTDQLPATLQTMMEKDHRTQMIRQIGVNCKRRTLFVMEPSQTVLNDDNYPAPIRNSSVYVGVRLEVRRVKLRRKWKNELMLETETIRDLRIELFYLEFKDYIIVFMTCYEPERTLTKLLRRIRKLARRIRAGYIKELEFPLPRNKVEYLDRLSTKLKIHFTVKDKELSNQAGYLGAYLEELHFERVPDNNLLMEVLKTVNNLTTLCLTDLDCDEQLGAAMRESNFLPRLRHLILVCVDGLHTEDFICFVTGEVEVYGRRELREHILQDVTLLRVYEVHLLTVYHHKEISDEMKNRIFSDIDAGFESSADILLYARHVPICHNLHENAAVARRSAVLPNDRIHSYLLFVNHALLDSNFGDYLSLRALLKELKTPDLLSKYTRAILAVVVPTFLLLFEVIVSPAATQLFPFRYLAKIYGRLKRRNLLPPNLVQIMGLERHLALKNYLWQRSASARRRATLAATSKKTDSRARQGQKRSHSGGN